MIIEADYEYDFPTPNREREPGLISQIAQKLGRKSVYNTHMPQSNIIDDPLEDPLTTLGLELDLVVNNAMASDPCPVVYHTGD